jgi:hypothetical protein
VNDIFISTVNPDSPIGQTKQIFVGDQILEVSGVSITSSEHSIFADIYKNASSPVEFVVQSLQTAKVCLTLVHSRGEGGQNQVKFGPRSCWMPPYSKAYKPALFGYWVFTLVGQN